MSEKNPSRKFYRIDTEPPELGQVGIGQFIMNKMAAINAEPGPRFLHETDNQLNYVDVFLEGDTPYDGERVPLTIFQDNAAGVGFDRISAKVDADLRAACRKLYVAMCSKCGEVIRGTLGAEIDPISKMPLHGIDHVCKPPSL